MDHYQQFVARHSRLSRFGRCHGSFPRIIEMSDRIFRNDSLQRSRAEWRLLDIAIGSSGNLRGDIGRHSAALDRDEQPILTIFEQIAAFVGTIEAVDDLPGAGVLIEASGTQVGLLLSSPTRLENAEVGIRDLKTLDGSAPVPIRNLNFVFSVQPAREAASSSWISSEASRSSTARRESTPRVEMAKRVGFELRARYDFAASFEFARDSVRPHRRDCAGRG